MGFDGLHVGTRVVYFTISNFSHTSLTRAKFVAQISLACWTKRTVSRRLLWMLIITLTNWHLALAQSSSCSFSCHTTWPNNTGKRCNRDERADARRMGDGLHHLHIRAKDGSRIMKYVYNSAFSSDSGAARSWFVMRFSVRLKISSLKPSIFISPQEMRIKSIPYLKALVRS